MNINYQNRLWDYGTTFNSNYGLMGDLEDQSSEITIIICGHYPGVSIFLSAQ